VPAALFFLCACRAGFFPEAGDALSAAEQVTTPFFIFADAFQTFFFCMLQSDCSATTGGVSAACD